LSDRRGAAAFRAAALLIAAVMTLFCARMNPASAAEAPPGAASCSGCHPSANVNAETPVPRLAGSEAGAIVAAMQAFRNGQRAATVMDRIARGFSDHEVEAIAAWFATQGP
jgi:cytochrome subunit of sulfide dehydrogenase